MKCTVCDNELKPGVQFCNKCGTAITFETEAPEDLPMEEAVQAPCFCSACGTKAEPEYEFCQKCGATLARDSAEEQPGKAVIYLKTLFKTAWNIIKSPITASRELIASGNFQIGLGLIGIQTLAYVLIVWALLTKLYNMFGGFLSDGQGAQVFKFLVFIVVLVFSMGCITAGILTLLAKAFKAVGAYKKMLCVAGASSMTSVPFVILGGLIAMFIKFDLLSTSFDSILSAMLVPIIIIFLGAAFGILIVAKTTEPTEMNDDTSAFFALVNLVLSTICLYTLTRLLYGLFASM